MSQQSQLGPRYTSVLGSGGSRISGKGWGGEWPKATSGWGVGPEKF